MTRQRQAVLEELTSLGSHPTADDVYARVRRRLPRVSLGTVYRNLELLSAQGVIRTLEVAGTQRRFDGTPGEHDHVRCVGCGRIDDVPAARMDTVVGRIRKTLGYRVTGRRLEFTGLCPKCRKTV
jgi:Fur family ferric uptake transcriptional regulator